jgi:hypothetical protein
MILSSHIRLKVVFALFLLALCFCDIAKAQQVPQSDSEVSFSAPSGWHPDEFNLGLSGRDTIFYTLDGTEPSLISNRYSDSIPLKRNWSNSISLIPSTHMNHGSDWPNNEFGFRPPTSNTLKCNTIIVNSLSELENQGSSEIAAFWIGEHEHTMPVVSIVSDSVNLFDTDSGIYVAGSHFDQSNPDWTGNYFQRGNEWERPAHLSYFDLSGDRVFHQHIGIRISGNASRRMPQKSLKLYFRSEYGESTVPNLFFPERTNSDYKRLVVRTPFTYWYWSGGRNTMFQDDLIHRVAFESHAHLDVALSTPVSVYLNNEYWGILNLRETHDRFFLESVYGLDRDQISIARGVDLFAEHGSSESLRWLFDFVDSHSLELEENYEVVNDKIDINNYIDYFIFQTYFGNDDWPVNNVTIWRPDTGNAKWRWFFYDLDGAMNKATRDPFEFMSEDHELQPKFFNAIMENGSFRTRFFSRYQQLLESTFKSSRIAEQIGSFVTKYDQEVGFHISRWGNPSSHQAWYSSYLALYRFSEERPCSIKRHIQARFGSEYLDDFNCKKESFIPSFDIYPNPTSSNVTLRFHSPSYLKSSIQVFDAIGKEIMRSRVNELTQSLDVSGMRSGVYFIRVITGNDSETSRLLIR